MFWCNKKRHYNNECLLANKEVRTKINPKLDELFHISTNPRGMNRKENKKKKHIIFFTCEEKDHYHSSAQKKEKSRKMKHLKE